MGNYASVLARMECHRDPLQLDPKEIQEEDTPNGILRRKLAVNFGSHYKKFNTRGHRKIASDNDSIEALFADTPNPYQSDAPDIVELAAKDVDTEFKMIQSTSSSSSDSANSIVSTHNPGYVIPPLHPRKRSRSFDGSRGIADSKQTKQVPAAEVIQITRDDPNNSVTPISSPLSSTRAMTIITGLIECFCHCY